MIMNEDDVFAVVESIWDAQLETDIKRTDQVSDAAMITGAIGISGPWDGRVVLDVDWVLAGKLAARMFNREDVTTDDVRDAVTELTNMIGGNLKGLTEGTSTLSIPEIVTTDVEGTPELQLDLESSGHCVRVRIFAGVGSGG